MKYEAQKGIPGWYVFIGNRSYQIGGDMYGSGNEGQLTVAEAKIIAFALNAVSENKLLVATTRLSDVDFHGWIEYDGPTDGVAP